MNPQTPLEDVRWLLGEEAAEWLRRVAEAPQATLRLADQLRRELSAVRTHLILEQADLRRRAAAKFPQAERMFFTPTGLEQATDHWVAAYKAHRFAGAEPVADLCCGVGGDLAALASRGPVLGVDRDPVTALVAEANLRALGLPGEVRSVDVTAVDLRQFPAWHIDPDRRPQGRRTTQVELHEPDAATLDAMLAVQASAAVKLAPAATLPDAWHEAEREWISRQRQCRQLVAWFGRLAQRPGRHRATLVFDSEPGSLPVTHTVEGVPSRALPVAPRLDRYVYDPDPAVLAAQLTAAVAKRHGLAAVAPDIPYLTGPQPVASPFLACFEVTEVLPLDRKRLKRLLEARGIGRLEIKKRGVPDEPEQLRRQLRLRGERAAVLLLAPLGGTVTAILAQRVEAG